MKKPSLSKQLKADPSLKVKLNSYSCNPNIHIAKQIQALNEIDNLEKSLLSPSFNPSKATKALSEQVQNFCSSSSILIETTVNYYAFLLNPISRYDFSHYINYDEINYKKLEANLFGSDKPFPTNPPSSENKLKILLAYYMNQITKKHHSEKEYPLNIPLNEFSNLYLHIPQKLPLFDFKNLYSIHSNYGISITKNHHSFSLSLIFGVFNTIIGSRNTSSHARPFDLIDKTKEGEKYDQQFYNTINSYLDKEGIDFFKHFSGFKEKDPSSFVKCLLNSLKTKVDISSLMMNFLNNEELSDIIFKISKHLLTITYSYEFCDTTNDNENFFNDKTTAYIFLKAISMILSVSQSIFDVVVNLIHNIKQDFSDENIILSDYSFKYIKKNHINNELTFRDYIDAVKKDAFGHSNATILDC